MTEPLKSIRVPGDQVKSKDPDEFTEREHVALAPSKQLAVEHARHLKELRKERDYWIKKCEGLEGSDKENAALFVVVSQSRWTNTFSIVAMAAGGGLISWGSGNIQSAQFGAGWALVVSGAVFLVGTMFSGGWSLSRSRPKSK